MNAGFYLDLVAPVPPTVGLWSLFRHEASLTGFSSGSVARLNIGFLTAVAGEGLTDTITAAIVIFRAAQWLAPIPIGWILLVIMRGSRWREIGQGAGEARPV